ncbi:GNAT family N-acetyltransferase [Demequina activiva]|uniref:N-acetyltransferase n=1 Tax=Demequina activiva TaxID=1582364 RepID=A0A919UG84_9MICO|nr:GNAT family N-acetyltransferase [Demequina activiva]GIG54189.1 N-acetyltransferase [Demequina activiva]
MSLVIRDAEPADGLAMGEIHVAAWRSAYAGIMDPEFLARRDPVAVGERWTASLRGDGATGGEPAPWARLVAALDGRVVAMAAIGPARDEESDIPRAQLWMLNSHPDAFGTGAATALHAEVIARLRERGETRAYLWVARDNLRARRFYEREGWAGDGGAHVEELGGVPVAEVRYVRDLCARTR